MLFSNHSHLKVEGDTDAGWVGSADGTKKPIGWGMYNSVSMFCVRLMQLEDEATRFVYYIHTLLVFILLCFSLSPLNKQCRTNQECASWLGTPLINKAGVLLLGKVFP